jgi:hypothetical protein
VGVGAIGQIRREPAGVGGRSSTGEPVGANVGGSQVDGAGDGTCTHIAGGHLGRVTARFVGSIVRNIYIPKAVPCNQNSRIGLAYRPG